MHYTRRWIVGLLCLALVGCGPVIQTARDDFQGTTTTSTSWLPMDGATTRLMFLRKAGAQGTTYAIQAEWDAEHWLGWMFIESGESLIFLADDQRIGLHGS